jgi:uncharacterized C2H2 Zn-finger protein
VEDPEEAQDKNAEMKAFMKMVRATAPRCAEIERARMRDFKKKPRGRRAVAASSSKASTPRVTPMEGLNQFPWLEVTPSEKGSLLRCPSCDETLVNAKDRLKAHEAFQKHQSNLTRQNNYEIK